MEKLSQFIWGLPMISLLLSTHLFSTFHLKGIQFNLIAQIKSVFMHNKYDTGDVSQWSSFMTILASTMGTGNILGVSTAIILGGPGSIFWMAIAGLLGMATKYAETWLAVRYRKTQNDGSLLGGAMVLLQNKHPFMSILFSLLCALTALSIGCSVQSNAASQMLKSTFNIPPFFTAVTISVLVAYVVFNGIHKITQFCDMLVPAVSTLYLTSCILLLILNKDFLLSTIKLICTSAFSTQAFGSGLLGNSVSNAIRYGVSRGLFTNEAGMGSTAIISASSQCSNPKTPSYAAMLSVFLDTVILCSVTGIVFISCCLHYPSLLHIHDAAQLSLHCFGLLNYGKEILCISIFLFAFSTILGWYSVAEKSILFLFGRKSVLVYRIIWVFFVFSGCLVSLDNVWSFADLCNAFMCLPNIYMLFCFIHEVQK